MLCAIINLKPIFHCDAKPFALGPGIGLDPQRPNFAKVGDTNMLVSKNAKICVTPNAKHKICVIPNAKPKREPMEYRLHWVPKAKYSHWPCRFHVVYPFFFTRWVANANAVLSGLRALELIVIWTSYGLYSIWTIISF